MNTFVTIKHINDFRKVCYYSICLEGEEESLFEKFLKKHSQADAPESIQRALTQIITWIQRIGNEIGAQPRYFRNEGTISDAKALPPPARFLESETGTLRLYCMACNESVVFLYSGGEKTTDRAQDCPNVMGHIRLANKLTKAITEAFVNRLVNPVLRERDAAKFYFVR